MTWDPVPYFTQFKGAAHSPEVFRTALYASTGGAEGVISAPDCKVVPTSVPGNQVVVSVGGALVLSRAPGGAQQTYAARNPTPDAITIPQTGSSGGRSDLIVVRIEDPGLQGDDYDDPQNPAVGPYVFTRIIPNVPSRVRTLQEVPGHENDSGVALARIDIPASTATITAAMVKDLRKIARPRETTETLTDLGVSTATLSATAGTLFPPYHPQIEVPDWATHVRVDVTIAGLSAQGSSNGFANLQVRDSSGDVVVLTGDQNAFNADVSSGSNTRFPYLATVYGDVRAQRGLNIRPSTYMRKEAAARGDLRYDQYAQMKYQVTFYERPI